MVFSGRQALDGADIVSLLPDEVRLQTAAGQSVQLSGDPTEGVESGSSFAGTLALPAETSNDINVAVEFSLDQAHPDLLAQLPEAAPAVPIDGVSELGQEILAASEALNASLAVVEATIAPPVFDEVQPAQAHVVDVTIVTLPSDPSASVISDSGVNTLVQTLGTYWASQSSGQVANISKPLAVQRFVSGSACDAHGVWDAGAQKFGSPDMYSYLSGSGARPDRRLHRHRRLDLRHRHRA